MITGSPFKILAEKIIYMEDANKIAVATNSADLTILSLFSQKCNIRIPAYQRAYSWENKQCKQFLDDLLEKNGKRYYLGQLLFEKDGDTLFIIDGQQRLTTTILFFAAVVKVLSQLQVNINRIKEIYLTDKFKTVDDDQVLFRKCTQKQLVSNIDDTETISQKRIINAYKYFEEELGKIELSKLNLLIQSLESATISTFFITNKPEATQVFEYQNNRGKDPTRFEVIKAYLMYQLYVNLDDTEAKLEIIEIQNLVSKIYRDFEFVEGYFTENELLDNFCTLFYSINGTIEAIKEKLGKEEFFDKNHKVNWIRNFFESLAEITYSARGVIKNKNHPDIANLFFVGNNANWKIVLLTLFYKGETAGDLFKKIVKLLEVLCFKLKLGDYRSDYLPGYAKRYFDNKNGYTLQSLFEEIKNATITGFKWNENEYFSNIITDYIENKKDHYDKRNPIKIILWQYENEQRRKNLSGTLLDLNLFEEYTIEHIKPQTSNSEKYSENFTHNFLHKAGNLALLTQSQNSKFSNKSFEQKRELFQDTALSSYTEIREKADWTEKEIDERNKNIVEFVKRYFDISSLT